MRKFTVCDPTASHLLASVNDNGETGRFAKSLQAALSSAGVNATVANKFIYTDAPQPEFAVDSPDGENAFLNALAGYLVTHKKLGGQLLPLRHSNDGVTSDLDRSTMKRAGGAHSSLVFA